MKKTIWGLFFVTAVLFSTLFAGENPRAMIVFDASGSMWGQIGGRAKIEIARDALKNVVREWNPNVELGLTVYGHRSKGDCNDIETIIPVGRIDKNRVVRSVMGIQPKGKTPISRSLRKAADALKYTEEKATIILISDGKETCDPDPCGTAKALEKEGIDFVTHVIGFNVDRKTDRQLECIAHVTGGEYFSAKNASALNRAMKVIVKKVETEKPKPKPAVIENTTLELMARYDMSPTGLNTSGVKWMVEQNGTTLYSGSDESPKIDAKVGKIHIVANYDRSSRKQSVEGDIVLKAQKKNKTVIQIKSGVVIIDAAEEKGGPKVKASVHIYPLLDGKANRSDEIAWCIPTKSKVCERVLPVGTFLIEASYDKMKTEKEFTLENKEKKNIHLYFRQTGTVEISASEKEGGKWIRAYNTIYKVEDGKRGSVIGYSNSFKDKAESRQLPVGNYIVKTTYNQFKKFTPIEVKAGKVTKIHIAMGQTGTVKVSASEKEGGKWIRAYNTIYKVEDGKRGSVVGYSNSFKDKAESLQLPVGNYIVKTTYNKFKKFTPIDIKPGETTKIHVIMGETGTVEISASEKEGGKWIRAYNTIYKVEDGKRGSVVGYSNSFKDKAESRQLPVGNYIVKTTYNKFKKFTPFEVKAGETTEIHVVFGVFFIGAKCPDMNEKVSYEIYGSNGRLLFDKKLACSKRWEVALDNGEYSIEAVIKNGKSEAKFSVAEGKPGKLMLDLTNLKHENRLKDMNNQ